VLVSQLGSGAADVAQLIPELQELLPELQMAVPLDPEGARFRLFDSTSTFLRNAASAQPLLLVLDDLHAADVPSLLFLRFMAGTLAENHIMVVGVYRDEGIESDHPLGSALAELIRERVMNRPGFDGDSEPWKRRRIHGEDTDVAMRVCECQRSRPGCPARRPARRRPPGPGRPKLLDLDVAARPVLGCRRRVQPVQ
jgi:hypothetical protein